MIQLKCKNCKQTFEEYPSDERDFCSRECYIENQTEGKSVNCNHCGEEFHQCPSKIERNKNYHFCSEKCMGQFNTQLTGKDAWAWKGGYETRGLIYSQWRKLREKILKRDQHECQFCGLTNEENKAVYDRGLHVHHVVDKTDGGKDHESNLLALCEHCHFKIF